ncbi:MAG: hypothetical protein AB7F28_06585 [Candidatus Margulisiibacteriota bacterium]
MGLDIEPYSEPRPSFFPPMVSPEPNRRLELEMGSFGKKLADTLNQQGQGEDDELSKEANVKIAKQIANFQKALDFMPRVKLAFIEFTGDKGNSEKLDADGYVDLRGKLNQAFWDNSKYFLKPRTSPLEYGQQDLNPLEAYFDDKGILQGAIGKRKVQTGDYVENGIYGQMGDMQFGQDAEGLFPALGNTWVHNLNLYHGAASWNPFKEGDKANYDAFNENPLYASLVNSFMSPLKILQDMDPELVQKMKEAMNAIQDTRDANFNNPWVGKEDANSLNWMNVQDPYKDSKVDTFNVMANYYDIGMSQMWDKWSPDQAFYFLLNGWEDHKRPYSEFQNILGKKVFDMPNTGDPESQTQGAQDIVNNVKKWWDTVGSKATSEGSLVPFRVMSQMASSVSGMMDAWGDWGDSRLYDAASVITDDKYGFKNKMINGYLNHVSDNYIATMFQGRGVVRQDDLFGTVDTRQMVLGSLKSQGLLSAEGVLTSKYKPSMAVEVPGLSDDDNQQLNETLQKSALGDFNLDRQAGFSTGNAGMSNIMLIGAEDGKPASLNDVLGLLRQGDNPLDRYKNARNAYNTFFDMYESMTGLGLETGGTNGKGVLKQVNGKYQMTVFPNAQWKQETVLGGVGGSETRTGPLTLTFDTEAQAQSFVKQVRSVIALLEPVVAGFDPANNNGPGHSAMTYEGGQKRLSNLRVLTDNSNSIDSLYPIPEDSPDYRIQVDFVPHHQTTGPVVNQGDKYQAIRGFDANNTGAGNWWEQVDKFTGGKAYDKIAQVVFGKGVGNRILRGQHKKQVEEYQQKKTEYEEEEEDKLVQERKRRNDRVAEENRVSKLQQQEREQRHIEQLQRDNQRRNEEAQKQKANQKKK